MRATDLPEVVRIAAVVPTAPHWPEGEFRRMLQIVERQPTRRGAWVAPDLAGEVRGFAMASQVAGLAELESVVTAPEHRRRGVGASLVHAAIAWSRGIGATQLVLEARESNHAALQLYASLGFVRNGLRRRYYRNPDEDAVLLSLDLLQTSDEKPETALYNRQDGS